MNDNFTKTQLANLTVPDGWVYGDNFSGGDPLPFTCYRMYNNSSSEILPQFTTAGNPESIEVPIAPYEYLEGHFTSLITYSGDEGALLLSVHSKFDLSRPVMSIGDNTYNTQQLYCTTQPWVEGYQIYRSESPDGPWVRVFTGSDPNQVMEVNPDTLFYWYTQAYVGNTTSEPSLIVSARIPPTPLDPPVIELTSTTPTSFTIEWTAVLDPERYDIYLSSTGNSEGSVFNKIGETTDLLAEITDLDMATEYWIRVRTYRAGEYSDYSNALQVITLPPTPANLAWNGETTTTVDISWNEVPEATEYTIYISTDGNGYSQLATTTDVAYTAIDLAPNTPYWFTVSCTKNGATSYNAEPVTGTTDDPP